VTNKARNLLTFENQLARRPPAQWGSLSQANRQRDRSLANEASYAAGMTKTTRNNTAIPINYCK
jgi:hypothetical protein